MNEEIKNKETHWSVMGPWNSSLTSSRFDRRIEPRDFLYGSEIGKNYLEVYWAMQGVEPTNLASDIARRKMEAGNLYEAMITWVLRRVGLLKESQTRVRLLDNPEYLNVYGRLDIVAGHDGNWVKTKQELEDLFLKIEGNFEAKSDIIVNTLKETGIEFNENTEKAFKAGVEFSKLKGFDFPFFNTIKKISRETIEFLSKSYPNGLVDKIYEVKTINSIAFWKNDQPISKPYPHHVRQLTFYQLYHPVKVGSFLYLDRDTMSISEIPNIIKEEVVKEIYDWLKQMTYYYRNKIEPPRPEIIIWDKKEEKFTFNWEVDRSQYRDVILKGIDVKEINEQIKLKNKNLNPYNYRY